ncbi:MAG TPA: hypothetical protein VJY62_00995 [Bacteroidia bacterium]|nr:hypothetical protein [Bacteroidia bacterium]
MEKFSITIVSEFKKGKIKLKEGADFCEWKTYLTDKENILLLRAFLKTEVKEVVYNASSEEFAHALKRAIQNN